MLGLSHQDPQQANAWSHDHSLEEPKEAPVKQINLTSKHHPSSEVGGRSIVTWACWDHLSLWRGKLEMSSRFLSYCPPGKYSMQSGMRERVFALMFLHGQ